MQTYPEIRISVILGSRKKFRRKKSPNRRRKETVMMRTWCLARSRKLHRIRKCLLFYHWIKRSKNTWAIWQIQDWLTCKIATKSLDSGWKRYARTVSRSQMSQHLMTQSIRCQARNRPQESHILWTAGNHQKKGRCVKEFCSRTMWLPLPW